MTTARDFFAELDRERPDVAEAWDKARGRVALAENIIRLRLARGLTQAELAADAGTKQPRIAELESGTANPRFETLERLALALDVPLSQLVEREDERRVDELRSAGAMGLARALGAGSSGIKRTADFNEGRLALTITPVPQDIEELAESGRANTELALSA